MDGAQRRTTRPSVHYSYDASGLGGACPAHQGPRGGSGEGRSRSWRTDWLSQPGSKTGDREQRTRLGCAEAVFKVKDELSGEEEKKEPRQEKNRGGGNTVDPQNTRWPRTRSGPQALACTPQNQLGAY